MTDPTERRYDVAAWAKFEPYQIAAIEPDVICRLLRFAAAEISRLKEELTEAIEEVFREGASYESDTTNKRCGWWCTNGRSSVKSYGDQLVDLGTWERHPDGYGRLWFYRPMLRPPPARRGSDAPNTRSD